MSSHRKHPDGKIIAFDIGNMIMRSAHRLTFGALDDMGVQPDKATSFFNNKAYGDYARGLLQSDEYAQIMINELEALHLRVEHIRAAHNAHIYMLDSALVDLITEISTRDTHDIVFVTTTNEWQTQREMELVNLTERFGPVARSHEMGFTKTEVGAWPKILAHFGYTEADIMRTMLIDDGVSNILAAEKAGLYTHHYSLDMRVGIKLLKEGLKKFGIL